MNVESFRDLIAWQKGIALSVQIYRSTALFPSDERFGLISQLRRAGTSVPANIAEGHERPSRDFGRFLGIAKGSLAEIETHLFIASELGYLPKEEHARLLHQITELAKIISGLRASLPTN